MKANTYQSSILILLLICQGCASEKDVEILESSSSLLPSHAEWELTFEETFEGDSVNWSVWQSQDYIRGGDRLEGRWPENNIVKNGILYQMTKREAPPRDGKDYSTAHIWTRDFTQQYGYFEARIKYGDNLNNAFWLWRPSHSFPMPNFEIDINEGRTPFLLRLSYHFALRKEGDSRPFNYASTAQWNARNYVKNRLDEDFNVYGLEWNEDVIVWYFNGKPIRAVNNVQSHAPADIRLSTIIAETHRAAETVGNAMQVDWVRAYQKVSQISEPQYPKIEEIEIPDVVRTPRQIQPLVEDRVIFATDFELDVQLPDGLVKANGDPLVKSIPSRYDPLGRGGKALRLQPGDYVVFFFNEPVTDFFEIELELYDAGTERELIISTLGNFDKSDTKALAESYYRGNIGAYIHWYRRFIQYYQEFKIDSPEWRALSLRQPKTWEGHRFVFDMNNNRFDYYSGASRQEFRNAGFFRHSQKKTYGVGFFNYGRQRQDIWIDNLTIRTLKNQVN